MSDKYLLPCDCGRKVTVEVSQAGRAARCECGARLDVPAMRQLRRLEKIENDTTPPVSAWTWRERVLVVGVLLLVGAAGLGLYLAWARPSPPETELQRRLSAGAARFRAELEQTPPYQVGQIFKAFASAPLEVDTSGRGVRAVYEEYEQGMRRHDNWVAAAWGLAGIGIASIAVASISASATRTPLARRVARR